MNAIYPSWPPAPGPTQPHTGYKTINTEVRRTFTVGLTELHEGAWWKGVRLMHASTEHMLFYVELAADITGGDGVVQPFGMNLAWYQEPGEWKALPWAIPARLATLMGLHLVITVITTAESPYWINTRLSFQDIGAASPTDQYVFVREGGEIAAAWDDYCSGWATETQGYVPRWATAHLVIPPMSYILRHPEWTGTDTLCLMRWRDPVKVDGVHKS